MVKKAHKVALSSTNYKLLIFEVLISLGLRARRLRTTRSTLALVRLTATAFWRRSHRFGVGHWISRRASASNIYFFQHLCSFSRRPFLFAFLQLSCELSRTWLDDITQEKGKPEPSECIQCQLLQQILFFIFYSHEQQPTFFLSAFKHPFLRAIPLVIPRIAWCFE